MKLFTKTTLAVAGIGIASMAFAADPLANTTWQTYDEGKPKGTVKSSNGEKTYTFSHEKAKEMWETKIKEGFKRVK